MRCIANVAGLCVAVLATAACSEAPPDSARAFVALPAVAAPGSAEPHLATTPGGRVIMSWLEPDGDATALRYSTLDGSEWSSPRTVAIGDDWFVNWADFPSVVAVGESLWAAHWLVKAADGTYEYDVAISLSADGGRTWQPPVTPHADGTLSEHGFVSLYPMPGGVGALWLDGRETANGGGMTLRSAVLSPGTGVQAGLLVDDLVCDCCQTDVAVGPDGPIAVYRNRTAEEIRDIYVTRLLDGRWEDGRPVGDDGWEIAGCPVNGPAIAASGDSVAVAWFTAADNEPIVKFAFSPDGAETFGAAVTVATDWPIGRVGILLVDPTTAIVSWLRQGEGGSGEVMARAVHADGRLGPARHIATTLAGRLSGFPQIAAHGDHIVFAWTGTGDGQKQVRSALYPTSSFLAADTPVAAAAPARCASAEGLAVQVLGSGGPIADDARASSSYLVWKDGQPRLLIDAGGGSFLRFGEAGASFADLDFIGLSHFHADHSADFPALLKSGYFSGRQRPLTVAGPSGSGPFPGVLAFLDSLLGEGGAFAYLGGYLDGTGGLAKLDTREVDIGSTDPTRVFENERFGIDALPVHHGIVPAVAFRIASGRDTIVFSSDQTLASPRYTDFARNASLVVLHMALPEGATSGTTLHATPGRIGEFATEADAQAVLLSHFMARSLRDLDGNTALVRDAYAGEVIVAEDLLCVTLDR
jgi:ribonuclease BN (tRNA processing enzyme)